MIQPLSLTVGFLPVVLFLIALLALDSFQLVTRRQVLLSIGWGALAAIVAFFLHRLLIAVCAGALDGCGHLLQHDVNPLCLLDVASELWTNIGP